MPLVNTRVVVDVDKNVVERYDYYPFGLVSRSSVSSDIETIQKFTGKELDDEHGVELYYFGARYHDPVTGRFVSVDPLASKYPGLSPYNYCANNPLILVDPDGKDFLEIAKFVSKTISAITISNIISDEKHKQAFDVDMKIGGLHNGSADAWRHASWSKQSSEVVGKGFTFVFGVAHEIDNLLHPSKMSREQVLKESQMDLTNNKIGRSLSNKNVDIEALAKKGKLKTLEPESNVEYKPIKGTELEEKNNEKEENKAESEG